MSSDPGNSQKSGAAASIQTAIIITIGVALSCVVLLAAVVGIVKGRWNALFSDPANFTEIIIPAIAFLAILIATWYQRGWLGLRERFSSDMQVLLRLYGHYEDAVRRASWVEEGARRAEASDPGSDKARQLATEAQEARVDLQQRRRTLRKLRQDLCDKFPADKGFAKRLSDDFPLPDEHEAM